MDSPQNSANVKNVSSRKKKKKLTSKSQESVKKGGPITEKCETIAPAIETTPTRTPETASETTTSNQSEECRLLEWLYVNRIRDSDQCVAWGSPQGSPTLRSGKRGSVGDPWSPTSESHSIQRKPPRRLINSSAGDLPSFLSELTALSERVRAHDEELSKKSSTRANSPVEESGEAEAEEDVITIPEVNDLTDTQTIKDDCELSSLPKMELVNHIANESFSALFDDDDDLMNECMLKCSQEVEESLLSDFGGSASRFGSLSSPQKVAAGSPRRRLPEKNALITRRTSPRNRSQTFQNVKDIGTKQLTETPKKKVPKVDSKFCVQSIRRSPMYCINGRLVGSPNHRRSIQKNVVISEAVGASSSSNNTEIADDSFEAVLRTFMDEDVELLSQALSEETVNRVASVAQQPQQSNTKRSVPSFKLKIATNHHSTMPIHRFNSEETKTTSNVSLQLTSDCVSKSYPALGKIQSSRVYIPEQSVIVLQEDSSESGSFSSSPPLQCTPEEIAKKKREAKLKLEKKKMTASMSVEKPIVNQWTLHPLKPLMTKRTK